MQARECRKHICFFGRCNVGKSSLVNALAGQSVAIVSEQSGTTTDVVKKAIELSGVGAAVLLDTAGLDDTTFLADQRVKATDNALRQVDLAVLLLSENRFSEIETEFLNDCKGLGIPYLLVYNKQKHFAAQEDFVSRVEKQTSAKLIFVSDFSDADLKALSLGIKAVFEREGAVKRTPLEGIVQKGESVLLVCPIDSSAPQGRLILPQVQVIRDCLDKGCVCSVVKDTELETALWDKEMKPDLVVTDSQVFASVDKIVPKEIPLTSFSILLARMKGAFDQYLKGTPYLDRLEEGDRVLMLESCTHQPTCEDIGRVKLPKMIAKHTGKRIICEAVGGLERLDVPLTDYKMIIQCGGCVATQRQILSRLSPALQAGIPVTNYGLAIAYMSGIFERATAIFKQIGD